MFLNYLTVIFVIMFIVSNLSVFFGDMDHGMDTDTDINTDVDVDLDNSYLSGFFSYKSFISFGTFFLLTFKMVTGLPIASQIAISSVVGILLSVIMFAFIKFLYSLRDERVIDLGGLVGKEATVYLSIAPNTVGKIEIEYKGHRVMDAISKNGMFFKTGSHCKIVEINGSTVIVDQL